MSTIVDRTCYVFYTEQNVAKNCPLALTCLRFQVFRNVAMKILITFRHVRLPVRSLESLTIFLYHSVLGIFANIYRQIATLRDYRLPPRCQWDRHFIWTLSYFTLFTAVMLHLFTFLPILYTQCRPSLQNLHPDEIFIFGPEMKSANLNQWQSNITVLQLYYQRAEIFA
jgi:hypothetical protein